MTKVCYMSLLILTRFLSMCWTCFVRTASDSRIKMLCYAEFNIHRSSRRKCVRYLSWNSTGYWLYVLYLLCNYVQWFAYFFYMLCNADFNIYRSSRRMCYMSVLILTRFFSMCWTCFVRTACDSRIKMLCYVDFNIHRSSRRKCVTYLDWNSTGCWLCALYLLCNYV